jgi:hypothetical protein
MVRFLSSVIVAVPQRCRTLQPGTLNRPLGRFTLESFQMTKFLVK